MSSSQRRKRRRTSSGGETPFPTKRLKRASRSESRRNEYTVGWICALSLEMAAAQAMLDEVHEPLAGKDSDSNAYTVGSIGPHNVVMACLPKGCIGTNNAAVVASNMLASFPSIKQRLMVGIGGGAPLDSLDIRLGDVVVGDKVVQYDLGKATPGHFERTAVPTKPPPAMLAAVSKLIATHAQHPSQIPELIGEMLTKYPSMTKFRRPDTPDLLYQHYYNHEARAVSCQKCDKSMLVERSSRANSHPVIHHGTIASGNAVIKDGVTRNSLASELQAICFEMETAGLGDSFPCLPIRGICDYSDSHKNKEWQEYAAAAAAAHAKELLLDIPGSSPTVSTNSSTTRSSPASLAGSASPPKTQADKHTIKAIVDPNGPSLQEKRGWLLKSLFFDQIELRRINIKPAHSKTCEWFLDHSCFLDWQDPEKLSQHLGFLWISGKPGAGKSTIMKFILAYMEKKWAKSDDTAVIYFFFNARGVDLEKSTHGMYRSLLYQIFDQFYDLQYLLDKHGRGRSSETDYLSVSWTLETLKDLYQTVVESLAKRRLVCLIDALDECDEDQVRDMVDFFEELGEVSLEHNSQVSICFASRHYPHIEPRNSSIRLTLEDQLGHSQDIDKYVKSKLRVGKGAVAKKIERLIIEKAAGVFMWVVLVVGILNKELQGGRVTEALARLKKLPPKLSDLFKDITRRGGANQDELLMCVQWVLYAKRPLTCEELYFAIKSGLSHNTEFPDEWDPEYETMDIIRLFILDVSKGLVEVTGKDGIVQFIHESVRDFLLKDDGIEHLRPGHLDDFEAISHGRLKVCCVNYARLSHSSPWHYDHIPQMPLPGSPSSEVAFPLTLRGTLLRNYPFLEYAATNLLYHANASSVGRHHQGLLDGVDLLRWRCLYNISQRHFWTRLDPSTPLHEIYNMQNYSNLMYEPRMESEFIRYLLLEPDSNLSSEPDSDPSWEPDSDLSSQPDSDLSSQPDSDLSWEPDSDLSSEPNSDLSSELDRDLSSEPGLDLLWELNSDLLSELDRDLLSEPDSDLSSEPDSNLSSEPNSDLSSKPSRYLLLDLDRDLSSEPNSDLSWEPDSDFDSPTPYNGVRLSGNDRRHVRFGRAKGMRVPDMQGGFRGVRYPFGRRLENT